MECAQPQKPSASSYRTALWEKKICEWPDAWQGIVDTEESKLSTLYQLLERLDRKLKI